MKPRKKKEGVKIQEEQINSSFKEQLKREFPKEMNYEELSERMKSFIKQAIREAYANRRIGEKVVHTCLDKHISCQLYDCYNKDIETINALVGRYLSELGIKFIESDSNVVLHHAFKNGKPLMVDKNYHFNFEVW